MSVVKHMRLKIEALLRRFPSRRLDVPPTVLAKSLHRMAQDYLRAARVISNSDALLYDPLLQLTGHAMELILKACIASVGQSPPPTHDLVRLAEHVESLGFRFPEPTQVAMLVHLNHSYFRHSQNGGKYSARYPVYVDNYGGTVVPEHAVFEQLFDGLSAQLPS